MVINMTDSNKDLFVSFLSLPPCLSLPLHPESCPVVAVVVGSLINNDNYHINQYHNKYVD